jgi:peroxiredoxin
MLLLAAALIWVVIARHRAPGFTVVTDRGKTISPSRFGGKLLVLNFWASWCAPCMEETPTLDAFERKFAKQGVVVLGVSIDSDEKLYREFLNRFHVNYDTWLDPQSEGGLAARYGTFQIPETYIINGSGRVVMKVPFPQDFMDPDFVAAIQKLL